MPYDFINADPFGGYEGAFGNSDQYTGETAEEFHDYLMTPRQQKRWSGSGGMRHFGPDRYASISKEDAAMADILMKQMEAEREMDFNVGARKSAEARRGAADELMMPQGRGGGSISFTGRPQEGGGYAGPRGSKWGFEDVSMPVGGGMPTGPPPGPPAELTEGQRSLIGGQFGESRVEAAKQNQYGRPRGPSPPTQSQIVNARAELESATMTLMNAAALDEAWADLTPEEMIEKVRNDRQNIPWEIKEALAPWAEANLKWNAYNQQPREQWPGRGGG